MVMQRLKHETAALHVRVEEFFHPDVRFATRESYVALLSLLHPFYEAFESSLAALPWNEVGFDFDERRKAPRLAADLRALGATPSTEPPQAELPTPKDLASGFGAMYVVEGATLGGRILRKLLRNRLGIEAANGGSFYDGYGDDTQRRWNEFGAAADRYCDVSQQRSDSAVAAATAVFTAFGRRLAPADSAAG